MKRQPHKKTKNGFGQLSIKHFLSRKQKPSLKRRKLDADNGIKTKLVISATRQTEAATYELTLDTEDKKLRYVIVRYRIGTYKQWQHREGFDPSSESLTCEQAVRIASEYGPAFVMFHAKTKQFKLRNNFVGSIDDITTTTSGATTAAADTDAEAKMDSFPTLEFDNIVGLGHFTDPAKMAKGQALANSITELLEVALPDHQRPKITRTTVVNRRTGLKVWAPPTTAATSVDDTTSTSAVRRNNKYDSETMQLKKLSKLGINFVIVPGSSQIDILVYTAKNILLPVGLKACPHPTYVVNRISYIFKDLKPHGFVEILMLQNPYDNNRVFWVLLKGLKHEISGLSISVDRRLSSDDDIKQQLEDSLDAKKTGKDGQKFRFQVIVDASQLLKQLVKFAGEDKSLPLGLRDDHMVAALRRTIKSQKSHIGAIGELLFSAFYGWQFDKDTTIGTHDLFYYDSDESKDDSSSDKTPKKNKKTVQVKTGQKDIPQHRIKTKSSSGVSYKVVDFMAYCVWDDDHLTARLFETIDLQSEVSQAKFNTSEQASLICTNIKDKYGYPIMRQPSSKHNARRECDKGQKLRFEQLDLTEALDEMARKLKRGESLSRYRLPSTKASIKPFGCGKMERHLYFCLLLAYCKNN